MIYWIYVTYMGTLKPHIVLFPALVPGTSDAYMPTKRKVKNIWEMTELRIPLKCSIGNSCKKVSCLPLACNSDFIRSHFLIILLRKEVS